MTCEQLYSLESGDRNINEIQLFQYLYLTFAVTIYIDQRVLNLCRVGESTEFAVSSIFKVQTSAITVTNVFSDKVALLVHWLYSWAKWDKH